MKFSYALLLVLALLTLLRCEPKNEAMKKTDIDVQGHRGARGLMPENTIPAFIKALDLGVTTLELDLAVTKNKELLVSHEPYMGAHLALDPNGQAIPDSAQLDHNIYRMSYEDIKKYDVGSKVLGRFPQQEKMKVNKPLLKEVVDAVNNYLKEHDQSSVYYNIEIKSEPAGDSLFHPAPQEYASLVYDFISQYMDTTRLNIQSFDFRILQYYHTHYPHIKLAALVENDLSISDNLNDLGFIPDIYSCYYPLLDSGKVANLQAQGMKVIPWTVNEIGDIKKVLNWGVDGIISDYPDRVLNEISN